jgi:exosortase
MEGRQIMVITMVQVLFLAVLGWRMWWAMSAALLYLYFLVPFGAFLTPLLQHFTAAFIPIGLDLLHIPNYADEYTIDIPAGRFYVAEACAGLRFLIASVAFGALYSALIYRSPWRRLAFMVASVVVPVIANGLRALGIVVLGHVLGSAEAAAADHIIYGWLFFSVVILLLVAAGMPFRQDVGPAEGQALPGAPVARGAKLSQTLPAGVTVAAMAMLAPAAAAWLDRSGSGAPPLVQLAAPAGCTAIDPPAAVGLRRFQCPTAGWPGGLTVAVQSFAPRVNPGIVVASLRAATEESLAEDAEVSGLQVGAAPAWRLTATTKPNRMTATMLWIDGKPDLFGLRARIRQAQSAISGTVFAPLMVAITADAGANWGMGADQPAARRAIAGFLQQHELFLTQVSGLAATPAGNRM